VTRGRTSLRLLRPAAVLLALASPVYCQLTIFPATLPDGTVNQSYPPADTSSVISTNGNDAGPTTWAITSGQLPPGLSLTPNGPDSAAFTGTPTAAGTYNFTVQATDHSVATELLTSPPESFSIRISAVVQITTTSLPQGTVGVSYSAALSATGGVPPYTWTPCAGISAFSTGVASHGQARRAGVGPGRLRPAATGIGSLPPGVSLSCSGQLSGTPTVAGTYSFVETVSDSSSTDPQSAGPQTFTIVVNPAVPLAITNTSPLPGGTVGTKYSLALLAHGGNPPYQWAVTGGTLPPGITLASNGSMTGVPTQGGTYNFTVTVTDESENTATGTFALVIGAVFSITTPSPLTPGAVGVAYSAQINVTPTTPPYSFNVSSGALPPGLSLSASPSPNPEVTLSGTPTTASTYTFTIVATDSVGDTASQSYTLVIGVAPITISPATLSDGTVGTAYSQQLTATGGAGGYTFGLGTGALPGGLTLSSSGLLSGTPTATGTFSFTVSVTDSKQVTVTQPYKLTINAAPLPTPTVTGVGSTAPPDEQPVISVELAQTYPTDLTGTMTLTFAPAAGGVDDPAIQFSTGGRTVNFTIPNGQTTAVFPAATISLGTGTVAGTITLTLQFEADGQNVTPQPAPTQVITIAPQAPVITNVVASTTSGGIEVDVTGFSNTRDMTSATFTFQAAAGTTLTSPTVTITVNQLFSTWYSNAASAQYGSQFTFAQPFNISGNASGITSVSVTLTNSIGTSTAMSASVP